MRSEPPILPDILTMDILGQRGEIYQKKHLIKSD